MSWVIFSNAPEALLSRPVQRFSAACEAVPFRRSLVPFAKNEGEIS